MNFRDLSNTESKRGKEIAREISPSCLLILIVNS
jgi:hypothetical protein